MPFTSIIFFIILLGSCLSKSYKDYEMVKVGYHDVDKSTINDQILDDISNVTHCEDMDEFIRIGPLHLLCNKNETDIVRNIAKKYGTDFKIITQDITKEIETTEIGRSFDIFNLNSFDHDTYLGGSSMEKWLQNLEQRYNKFMQIKIMGHSHEKRKILCVVISKSDVDPIVFIDAGMHAREWIAPATSLFLIDHILRVFSGEEIDIGEFHKASDMKKFQWHIVPNINPDGYHFTRTEDRFWSKNRRPSSNGSECHGVNLNRNFPSGFGKGPRDPCSRAYVGKHPLSEPETQAIANYFTPKLTNMTVMAISLHCFGQTLFTPFAYDGNPPHPLIELMETMLDDATHHMLPNYYQYGLVKTYLRYKDDGIGGTSMDFYADKGVPFAYTWELPDLGQHGMLMPSNKIKEIGQEVMTGLSRMTAWICDHMELINKEFSDHQIHFESTTTSSKPIESKNNCCLKIQVESSGPAMDQHSNSMGVYEATEHNEDNRYIYKKSSNNPNKTPRYLYYLPIYGIWMVGNHLGQSYATIFHFDDTICPEELNDSWFFFDQSWKNSDSTLTVKCAL